MLVAWSPVFSLVVLLTKLDFNVTGFIAMYATLASRDVDCCLIPESPFYLEGPGGLFEYIEKRLKENGHMVIVIAEGAGQDLLSESLRSSNQQDASGNKLLQDVGLWISQRIKVCILFQIVSCIHVLKCRWYTDFVENTHLHAQNICIAFFDPNFHTPRFM